MTATEVKPARPLILVVDDEERNRKLMEALLVPQGYLTVMAEDGQAAIAAVEQHHPDLVLLDVMMPGMDGFEVCRRLKERKEYLPVLMITSLNDRESRLKGIESGADDFLSKPVDRDELRLKVRNFLSMKELYDRLDTSYRALKESERQRENLTAFIVHDLKSPLSGVLGYLTLLSESPTMDEGDAEDVGMALQSVDRVLDITRQAKAEAAVQASERKFRKIFDTSPEAIVVLDNKGTILEMNDRIFDWLGYRAEDCLGKNFLDLPFFPEKSKTAAAEAFARRIQGDQITPYDLDFITKSGEKRVGRILGTPMTDETGAVTGSLIVVSDITDRKRYEEAMIAAKVEAESASRAKSDFLSSMSHELRTPLNAIIGFSEVLQEQYFGELNEKQDDYVNDILTSSRHLLELINDILDLSKVEAGKMELEPAPVGLKGLLEGSLVMIKEKAHRHGIKLSSIIPEDMTDLVFTADERKLQQVMYNLLSNAAKFTPDGGSITVETQRSKAEITVSVTDTGIGLSPDTRERVFDSFYQVSGGLADKTAGTGLGLPLSRMFVELHGGRLWVESEGEGHGCRFSFTLPLS